MRYAAAVLVVAGVLSLSAHLRHARADEPPAGGPAARLVDSSRVLVIGHRGDSKVAPENTLPAFASAVKAGADLVELDYYHSADGVPIVIHDSTLDRTTDACKLWGAKKIKVTDKSLADLQLLDAGNWFSDKFAGTRLPTLAEAMDTIQAGSITLIERKGGDPATCVKLLKQKKLLDDVVVQAFDWKYLEACHQLDPSLVMAALGDGPLKPERLDRVKQTGARVVAWEDRHTTKDTIAAIHAQGWKAWVWTVDNPDRVRELVQAKIDGIITNRPAQARAAVAATEAASKPR